MVQISLEPLAVPICLIFPPPQPASEAPRSLTPPVANMSTLLLLAR